MSRTKKILITGPESSGKSVLTEELSKFYGAIHTTEYAREYLAETGNTYTLQDLDEILKGQLNKEELLLKTHSEHKFLFCDTGPIVMYIWSQFRFKTVAPTIQQAFDECTYDLILLLKPNLPWEPDELRESPDQTERDQIFELFQDALTSINAAYYVIDLKGNARTKQAVNIIDNFLI